MNIIKFPLAIMLFICLLDMPYGYFQLVRFLALVGFSILAFDSYRSGRETQAIVFVCLAILFQPLFKISLGRQLWNIIDVAVGVWLLVSMDNLKSILRK
jgi:hypothetical protein